MDDHTSWSSASARRPVPSWPTVIATTVRLWLKRRRGAVRPPSGTSRPPSRTGTPPSGTGRHVVSVRFGLAIVLVAGLAAATTAAVFAWGPRSVASRPAGPGQPEAGSDPRPMVAVRAAAATRDRAAAWIATQLATNAIVACDPAMCAALQATGLPAGRLLMLRTAAIDPLGSDVVVATPALRDQFGTRLTGVYAPAVIASFGSGADRIDIRAIAPDGLAAYQAAMRADRAARITAGRQLLGNRHISVSADARAALRDGAVDPRLLVVLATLAAQRPVRIIAFSHPSPGASPALPLRGVQIAPQRAGTSGLRSMLSFLNAQRPPFLPVRSSMTGTSALTVEYSAPSPLGLLG
jgi:hypothetical protein